MFAQRGEREDAADDDDIEIPVLLHRVRALKVKLNQFVIVHMILPMMKARHDSRRVEKSQCYWGMTKSKGEFGHSRDHFGSNNNGWSNPANDRECFFRSVCCPT